MSLPSRKGQKPALLESQLRYRAVIEQNNEGITIVDLEGRFI